MAKTPQQREQARQARVVARTAEQKPLVGPAGAAIASLILPGLGQSLARQTQRGLLIFFAMATSIAIFATRVAELGRRVDGFGPTVMRALDRRPGFIILVTAVLVLIWLVNIWDGYRCSREHRRPTTGIFALVLAGFFVLGWQIAEIDVVKLVREAPEALPPLSRVMWPWAAAVEYEEEALIAEAEVLEGEGPAPERAPQVDGEPYLLIEPNVGRMSSQDENFRPVEGTRITLTGTGLEPNTETEVWWEDPVGNEFRPRSDGEYIILQTDETGAFQVEMTMPYRLTPPVPKDPFSTPWRRDRYQRWDRPAPPRPCGSPSAA